MGHKTHWVLYQPSFQWFILLHCASRPHLSLSRHICITISRCNTEPRTRMQKVESVCFTAALLLAAGPPTSERCGCTRLNVGNQQQPASTAPGPQPQLDKVCRWHQRLVSHGQNLWTLRDRGANLIETPKNPLQSCCSAPAANVRRQCTHPSPWANQGTISSSGRTLRWRWKLQEVQRLCMEKALTSLQPIWWETFQNSSGAYFRQKLPSKIPLQWVEVSTSMQ